MDNITPTSLLDCGHKPTPSEASFSTGYAIDSDQKTMCYPCADERQREDLKTRKVVVGYLSEDCKEWTTWTGGKLGRVTRFGSRHPWSHSRHYITVRDIHGTVWHGTGGPGEWATLRKSKGHQS